MTLQVSWPSKTVTLNDRFHCIKSEELHELRKVGDSELQAFIVNDLYFRELVGSSRSGAVLPGQGRSSSANVTPTSTPSPKKRQLPQIPVAAQNASRDRGKKNGFVFQQ